MGFTKKHFFAPFILALAFLFGSNQSFCQMADEELAAQFYGNKEYAKAADMYEKLLNKNQKSVYFYDNLLNCYLQLKEFNQAEKLCKKQSRRFENQALYQVDIAYLYRLQSEDQKAITQINSLIQKLKPFEPAIFELAKALEKRNEKAFAVQTYLKGRNLLRNEIIFANELGGLYLDLGDKKMMMEEFLNVLVLDESNINEVQGLLQNSVESSEDFDQLKQLSLLKSKINRQWPLSGGQKSMPTNVFRLARSYFSWSNVYNLPGLWGTFSSISFTSDKNPVANNFLRKFRLSS